MHAHAYLRDAAEYMVAANVVDDSIGSDEGFEILSPKVSYYLACHALELAAKAVLVHVGWDENQLKGVSHRLSKCVHEAKQNGMKLELTSDEEGLIQLLDKAYIRLRYPERGEMKLPVWGPLTEILVKVIKAAIQTVPQGEKAIRPEALDRLTGFACWHA